jgi:hypothetical protein
MIQINKVHIVTSFFFEISLNIVVHLCLGQVFQAFSTIRFSHYNFECISKENVRKHNPHPSQVQS